MITAGTVPDQARTDPEARQEGTIDVHLPKKGRGDVSHNGNDRVQGVPIGTQASLTIDLLHRRDEIPLRQCSARGA